MRQLVQNLRDGRTTLETIPAPAVKEGYLLIQTGRSLVSLGTEKMLVGFGKAGWIDKARQQPERVKQVLEKVKTDGFKPTLNAVFNKLNQPIPLGYSNAGRVIGIGKGIQGFQLGDRVASNGPHAEVVSVPKNLVVKIPDSVSDEEAAFATVGAVALQGIRLVQPSFGETVAVIGLGLIGQLTIQLLKANGCRVIGIDLDEKKLELARSFGIETCHTTQQDVVAYALQQTSQVGVDAVIITASNSSNEPVTQAARMSRKRGRIVLVGVTGLELSRSDFYEKELSFQVSCSYGPGRYDPDYEQKGQDYPIGFVRWTEQRNMEAVLQAIAQKQLNVVPLITERVSFSEFGRIYDNLEGSKSIASILEYPDTPDLSSQVVYSGRAFNGGKAVVGVIGAGQFTQAIVLQHLKTLEVPIKMLAASGGLSAGLSAQRFGAAIATTSHQDILQDTDINTVFITTRHHQHATMVVEALNAGKHVFVEKPLALNQEELAVVETAYNNSGSLLAVGFNRRYAPLAQKMKSLLGDGSGLNLVMTVNAGAIPKNHWTQDAATGGGRLIGEVCHFIDLCAFLTDSLIISVVANALNGVDEENVSILLRFANGASACINYFANGSKAYDKERIEAYQGGRTLILENWRKLKGYGYKQFSTASSVQDKGHLQQFRTFIDAVENGKEQPVPFEMIMNVSKATLAAAESLKTHSWVAVG